MDDILGKISVTIEVAQHAELDSAWKTERFLDIRGAVIPFARLYFPVEGEGFVSLDGREYLLEPGKVLLVPPHAAARVNCPRRLVKYWCHFNAPLPGTSLDLFSVYRPTYELAAVDPVFTENLFKLLVRSYHEYQAPVAAPDKFEAEGALRLLLAPFVRTIPAIQGGPAFSSDKISGVILYLEDNLHRRLSLKELGAEFKLNPTYLSNLFREKMGVPLMNYRNKRRIERAVELLWNTTFNVSEIAYKVGFPNVSSFSKAFSGQTGHSPREYRRLLSR